MAFFRCTTCQPSATPKPNVLYSSTWFRRCPKCSSSLTCERILGVVSKEQEALEQRVSAIANARARSARQREDESDDDDDDSDVASPSQYDAPPVARIVRMSDVKARTNPPRLPMGEPGLDAVTGGGWVRGQVYALFGPPGCGKGRLLRLIAALLCKHGPVIFASTTDEEETDLVAGHFETSSHEGVLYKRMPYVGARLHAIPGSDFAEDVVAHARNVRPAAVLVDSGSSQKVRARDVSRLPHVQQLHALRLYKQSAQDTNATYIVVFHAEDDGTMRGGQYLQHTANGGVIRVTPVRRLRSGRVEKLPADEEFEGLLRLASRKGRFSKPTSALYRTADCGIVAEPDIVKPADEEEREREPEKSTATRVPTRAKVPNVPAKGQSRPVQGRGVLGKRVVGSVLPAVKARPNGRRQVGQRGQAARAHRA